MPAYRVETPPSVERDLQRLSPLLLDRVEARVNELAEHPRPAGSQKLSGLDAYRVRVGDDRIIYEIDETARIVTVTRVRRRREVYRKLR